MPRLSRDQWESVRAEREAGTTFAELAKRYGVSVGAIHRRAQIEAWGDGRDVAEIVRRRAAEKVNGILNGVHPKKRAEALDRAAERAAEVIERHKADWAQHRQIFGAIAADFEAAKHAKIAAEMLRIRHQGERSAWGLDESAQAPQITIRREW